MINCNEATLNTNEFGITILKPTDCRSNPKIKPKIQIDNWVENLNFKDLEFGNCNIKPDISFICFLY